MVRMVHAVKLSQSKFSIFFKNILKIGAGFERIQYLLVSFIILQHVTACIWIFIGMYFDDMTDNWICMKGY